MRAILVIGLPASVIALAAILADESLILALVFLVVFLTAYFLGPLVAALNRGKKARGHAEAKPNNSREDISGLGEAVSLASPASAENPYPEQHSGLDLHAAARRGFKKAKNSLQPQSRRLLVDADELAKKHGYRYAIEWASRRASEEDAHTVHVLRANQAVHDQNYHEWESAVNAYLSHFDVAPIRLDHENFEAEENILDRLSTAALPAESDGPLVSVIMSAWNAEDTLRMAANSILGQTWRNLELFIVDDCSTDQTWDIAQEIAREDPRVTILRNIVNVGPYVSRNVAVSQATGEWITTHDADDWAHPERIARQIRFCAERNTEFSTLGILRLSDRGAFVRLNSTGRHVIDGALRTGFVTLMVSSAYFRKYLGSWDAVKVAGDAELIGRIEAIERFPIPRLVLPLMFCLDNPRGLTNDEITGLLPSSGLSKPRSSYRDAYRKWHSTISKSDSHLPLTGDRRFLAPAELGVSPERIQSAIEPILLGQTHKPVDFS